MARYVVGPHTPSDWEIGHGVDRPYLKGKLKPPDRFYGEVTPINVRPDLLTFSVSYHPIEPSLWRRILDAIKLRARAGRARR